MYDFVQTGRAPKGIIARKLAAKRPQRSELNMRNPRYKTLSVNMPENIVEHMRRLKFYHDVSTSGIVEQALLHFFVGASDCELGEHLRSLGAARRRRVVGAHHNESQALPAPRG